MKQTFDDLPEGDELASFCTWSVKVGYIDVTSVFIKNGEVCVVQGEPVVCDAAPGSGCQCGEAGKSGCFVGNQLVTQFEEFHFGDAMSRDSFFLNILDIISSTASVDKSHPVSASKLQNTAGGCVMVENSAERGAIGYDQFSQSGTGPKTSTKGTDAPTIIGRDGFMLGGFQGEECIL